MVATGNLRYIGMIKLTGVEINESDPLNAIERLERLVNVESDPLNA